MFFMSFSLVLGSLVPLLKTPFRAGCAFFFTVLSMRCYLMSMCPVWYVAVFFLVYVGAILVLFLYMCSLSPNIIISGPKRSLLYVALVGSIMLVVFVFRDLVHIRLEAVASLRGGAQQVLAKERPKDLLCRSRGDLLLLTGVLLFLALVCVVKTCKYEKGPLRPFKRSSK